MWLGLLAGCQGTVIRDSFWFPHEWFPFDCERTWVFTSTDPTVPYRMVASSHEPPQVVDGTAIYTVVYTTQCLTTDDTCRDGEVVREIRWSSTEARGVLIHGYTSGEGLPVAFQPPLQLLTDNSNAGASVETVIGAATWTSVFEDIEPCPVLLPVEWTDCLRLSVSTDDGDGAPLAGTWWAIGGPGVVAFEVAGDSGQWQLSETHAVESEVMGSCDGEW
jgi:hypothetical protein